MNDNNYKRKELFRDTSNGKVAGVCAGLADYFGWEVWLVRVVVISGVIFQFWFILILYFAALLVLNKKPLTQSNSTTSNNRDFQSKHNSSYRSDNSNDPGNVSIKVKTRIWQAGEPPKQALHDIHSKFKVLEQKLIKMEGYVTSSEFMLNREINRL